MRLENAVAADVLERILSAYGFTMQKELSDKLGIAKSNVASWLQRGQVPGNVLVQCALDTGADIQWLVTGVFAKANIEKVQSVSHRPLLSGQKLINKMLSTGGRPVLQRVMDAYGFTTQKELSEYLGISTGTISTWVRREYFPGDVVITCSLDTGAPLEWLAVGIGKLERNVRGDDQSVISLTKWDISTGELIRVGKWICDASFVSTKNEELHYLERKTISWIVDFNNKSASNGKWLLDIDGVYDVYDIIRLPGNKLNVTTSAIAFECLVGSVSFVGKVIKEIKTL